MIFPKSPALSASAVCLFLAACGPSVEILHRPVVETETARALTSSTALEVGTRQTLRREDLLGLYKKDSHSAIRELARRYEAYPTPQRRLALAEMSSDSADRLTESQPLDALGRYLDAAWLTRNCASNFVDEESEDPEHTIYKYVSTRVARLIREESKTSRDFVKVNGNFHTWNLSLEQGEGKADPRDFDILVPARWLKTDGLDWNRVAQEGVGTAMVGQIKATPEMKGKHPLIPKSGWTFPLNARIEFEGERARLVLQDLMKESKTPRGLPLEADFSAAVSFIYHDGDPGAMGRLEGLFLPQENQEKLGMYSVRPHESGRIPLVLVHGLVSRAEAWAPFINLLLADPVVRERYQILLFNYPTGAPILKSAADLREALADYQERYDPSRINPRMRDMVILGHSMGGIISNAQIRTSGDRIYDALFTKELHELDLSEEEAREFRRLGYFEANPDIERAILLAAPLRGSAFATNRIGQAAANLIRFPFNVVDAVFGRIQLIDGLTDVAQNMSQRPRNSINSLRPDNPVLGPLLRSPVRPSVRIHSIMAQRNPNAPKERGSDGLVRYTSAHLDQAVSEVVVRGANHRGMVERQETVSEVLRILRLHVRKR